jgi:hypothetical protein
VCLKLAAAIGVDLLVPGSVVCVLWSIVCLALRLYDCVGKSVLLLVVGSKHSSLFSLN